MGFWSKKPKSGVGVEVLGQARALLAEGAIEQALERFDAYVAANPNEITGWAELARALVKADRLEEAHEIAQNLRDSTPLVLLAQGEALAALGELEPALQTLARARDWYRLEAQRNFNATYAQEGYAAASQLYDMVYADLHGHEQVVVEHATRGQLNARAGVNYRLLGDSLMVDSKHRPEVMHLESVDDMKRRLRAMSAEDQSAVRGLIHAGAIAFREGRAADAVSMFERAAALDGTHFACFRGLGAAMDLRDADSVRRANELPLPQSADWRGLDAVVTDLANLTPVERKIVLCSIEPLRHALPILAQASVRIAIMPLDARATDYPEFAEDAAHRFEDDHRALSALSGVAGRGLALVRIDEMFGIDGEHAWVFAHEFSHLAHRYLAADRRARITRLFERAASAGYVASGYARRNQFEFFAVHYAEYVMRRHDIRLTHERDDLGVWDDMAALFDEIGEDESAFVPSLDADRR